MANKTDILKPKPSDSNRLAMYWLFNKDRITLPYSSAKFLQDWSGKTLDVATFLKTYNFGYLEFGRYVQENRRINMFYSLVEGCTILSSKLFFNSANLGMDRELSVSYGARGQGGRAAAFYDPLTGFINLTKESGIGCFAHEYAHALDNILGSRYETAKNSIWLSDSTKETKTPLRKIVNAIINETLRQINMCSTKRIAFNEQNYWYRRKEVFARAFEAWVNWSTRGLQKGGYPYKADLLVCGMYANHSVYPSEFNGKLNDLFIAFCILAGQAMNGKSPSELKTTTKNQSSMIKPTTKTKRTKSTTKCKSTTRKTSARKNSAKKKATCKR